MSGFKSEKQLWQYLKPRLAGDWWRVETIMPEGFPDAMGIFNGRLIFLELKIGEPAVKSLRLSQVSFMLRMSNAPEVHCYVAFGSRTGKNVELRLGFDMNRKMVPHWASEINPR